MEQHPAEVLKAMPVEKSDPLYLITLPSAKFLGTSDRDFSNVTSNSLDGDANISGSPQIAFLSTGRLGCLRGGLLHLEDVREILSREEIHSMSVAKTAQSLEEKRRGFAQSASTVSTVTPIHTYIQSSTITHYKC